MSEIESKNHEAYEWLEKISDEDLIKEVLRRNWVAETIFKKVALEELMKNWLIKDSNSAIQGVISENSEAELIQNIQNFMDTYKDLDIDINDYRISITKGTINVSPKGKHHHAEIWFAIIDNQLTAGNNNQKLDNILLINKHFRKVTNLVKNYFDN